LRPKKMIETSNNMTTYRNLMNSIIHEKEGSNIEEKTKKAFKRAMKIIVIGYELDKRDEEFELQIKEQIREICSLKVGRKLIKCLEQALMFPKIPETYKKHFKNYISIRMNNYDDRASWILKYHYVYMPKNKLYYISCTTKHGHTFNFKKHTFIVLAHELIHALHAYSGLYHDNKEDTSVFLLKDIDGQSEQKTIIGYDSHYLSNKNDVICENAFLLASGNYPRINHLGQCDDAPFLDYEPNPTYENISSISKMYFDWLEKEFSQKS